MTLMQSDGTYRTTATETVEGPIPHLHILWHGYAIDAPVKIEHRSRHVHRLPRPLRTPEGELIYALPGGMEVVL